MYFFAISNVIHVAYLTSPCEQSLFYLFPSYTEKIGSAQISSILWCRRSPSSWASHSCLLSSSWFFKREHQFLGEIDDRNWARRKQVKMEAKGPAKGDCEKWTPIRPGFETVT